MDVDLIERTDAGGTLTGFPIYDAHGNDVGTLSRSGIGYVVNDRRSYDAWGSVRAQQSPGAPTLRYCASLGHRQDDESGLVYMRARYYEPTSGRFISEDPAQQGGNWLIYCENNPVTMVDPSGKGAEEVSKSLLNNIVNLGLLSLAVGSIKELTNEFRSHQGINFVRVGLKGVQGTVLASLGAALGAAIIATVATGGVAAIAAAAILAVNVVLFLALMDMACDELIDKVASAPGAMDDE